MKTVGAGTPIVTRYLYDGDDVLAEYTGATPTLSRAYNVPFLDEPITVTDFTQENDPIYAYHLDHQNSVRVVTDSTQATVNTYDYMAHGEVYGTPTEAVSQPYRFTSRNFDPERNDYYFRNRIYRPQLGAFISIDPTGYPDGMSGYLGYFTPGGWDPYGLFEFTGVRGDTQTGVATVSLSIDQPLTNWFFRIVQKDNDQDVNDTPVDILYAQQGTTAPMGVLDVLMDQNAILKASPMKQVEMKACGTLADGTVVSATSKVDKKDVILGKDSTIGFRYVDEADSGKGGFFPGSVATSIQLKYERIDYSCGSSGRTSLVGNQHGYFSVGMSNLNVPDDSLRIKAFNAKVSATFGDINKQFSLQWSLTQDLRDPNGQIKNVADIGFAVADLGGIVWFDDSTGVGGTANFRNAAGLPDITLVGPGGPRTVVPGLVSLITFGKVLGTKVTTPHEGE